MITDDDGFAYARTVRHLLETGEYQLDNWAAANPPAQIFVAAGLAKLFGYSIKVLVVSTLVLLMRGNRFGPAVRSPVFPPALE